MRFVEVQKSKNATKKKMKENQSICLISSVLCFYWTWAIPFSLGLNKNRSGKSEEKYPKILDETIGIALSKSQVIQVIFSVCLWDEFTTKTQIKSCRMSSHSALTIKWNRTKKEKTFRSTTEPNWKEQKRKE